MLIYLDSNLLQYYADYQDFIFEEDEPSSDNELLLRELEALRKIIEMEQLSEGWHVAAPKHLMNELLNKANDADLPPFYVPPGMLLSCCFGYLGM